LSKLLKTIKAPSGFVIVPIHYTHDPDKSSAEWVLEEQAKYRREAIDWEKQWNREMELDFTAVSGSPAYPALMEVNQRKDLIYNEVLPLCLCCDFNVEPMVWEIAQIHLVDGLGVPCFIDEIMITPGRVDDMIEEFRNRYPAHPSEVWIYGDATGRGRTAQTAKSYYDLIRLSFRGYSADIRYKVPMANPSQRDRINAFNLKLRNPDGRPECFVHSAKCPELIKDLREVVTKEDGTKIVKSTRREDPYFWRTHASDAAGYFIWREWPVLRVARRAASRKRRRRRRYTHIYGEM